MTLPRLGLRLPEGGQNLEASVQAAVLAEESGFHSVWVGEHHGYDTYWPSPHFLLMAVAARTKRIHLGTNVLILPLADPVRLAGEWSMLDALSDGRSVLGVGVGWDEPEFAALGCDLRTRGRDCDRSLELLRFMWTSDVVTWSDEMRTITDFRLSPRPSHDLRVWVGGRSAAARRRAALHGEAWFPDAALSVADVVAGFAEVDELRTARGIARTEHRPLVRHVVIGPSMGSAHEAAVHHFRMVHDIHLRRGNPMVREAWADIDTWLAERVVIGDVSACRDQLHELVAATGATEIVLKVAGASDARSLLGLQSG